MSSDPAVAGGTTDERDIPLSIPRNPYDYDSVVYEADYYWETNPQSNSMRFTPTGNNADTHGYFNIPSSEFLQLSLNRVFPVMRVYKPGDSSTYPVGLLDNLRDLTRAPFNYADSTWTDKYGLNSRPTLPGIIQYANKYKWAKVIKHTVDIEIMNIAGLNPECYPMPVRMTSNIRQNGGDFPGKGSRVVYTDRSQFGNNASAYYYDANSAPGVYRHLCGDAILGPVAQARWQAGENDQALSLVGEMATVFRTSFTFDANTHEYWEDPTSTTKDTEFLTSQQVVVENLAPKTLDERVNYYRAFPAAVNQWFAPYIRIRGKVAVQFRDRSKAHLAFVHRDPNVNWETRGYGDMSLGMQGFDVITTE